MADQPTGTIKKTAVETTEEPFIPGTQIISAVLQPVPEEDPYYPPEAPFDPLPPFTLFPSEIEKVPTKSVIIDIETTGSNPWDSRITVIGALDINRPGDPQFFYGKDEKVIVEKFMKWFDENGFNEIIGYNVSFDHRFIFSRMLRYMIPSGAFSWANLYDLMSVMKQVQMAFVYGFNKPGSLGEWGKYLFNLDKTLTFEEILKAWEDGRINDIIEHNARDLELTYLLWVDVQYVMESGRLAKE